MTAILKRSLRQAIYAAAGLGSANQLTRELRSGRMEIESKAYLTEILAYAKKHSTYYRKNGASVKDISNWPILTKQIITENFEALKSDLPRRGVYANSSGGSTGNPTTVLQDLEFRVWSNATLDYYFEELLGISQFEVPHVILWGSERDTMRQNNTPQRVFNWINNTTLLNSFKISPKQWPQYVDKINEIKPVYIKGYASSLYELARYVKKSGVRIYSPKFAYSTAETLTPEIRRTIEEALQCRVFNFYGTREVGTTAGECQKGRMHIFTFNNLVELEPDTIDQKIGGSVLITSLHNFAMPIIRYQIGDTAILGGDNCPCGSRLPTIANITGRKADHFKKKDGTMIYGDMFSHLFYGRSWIRQFQVNQYDYTRFEVLVVLYGQQPKVEELESINKQIDILMGEACQVAWVFKKAIPVTPQGKHLYTRCLIKD